jgi:allophanate hydrolase subunit 1
MPRPRRRAPPRRRSPAAVLRTAGEGGLVVELADVIDPAVNARVHRLARAVRERLAGRVTEVVPTHRSLLVRHDPLREPRRRLARDVLALSRRRPTARSPPGARAP